MHTKARSSEYPGTNVKRFPVPSEFVDWKVPFREYKPMDYTSEKVLQNPPWADPDIRLESQFKTDIYLCYCFYCKNRDGGTCGGTVVGMVDFRSES